MIYEKEVCYILNIHVLFGFAISIHISWPHIKISFAIIFISALYMHQNLRLMLDGCVCMCMCVCVCVSVCERVCIRERERERSGRKREGKEKGDRKMHIHVFQQDLENNIMKSPLYFR